mgnify:FL=1
MDIIFVLAILFLPFDNLFFAPSNGWAAISPLLFFAYIFLNVKYLKSEIKDYRKIFIFFSIFIVLTILNFAINGYNLSAFFDTMVSFAMGFSTLLALDIYFIKKKNDFKPIVKMIYIVYLIALFAGILEFFTIKFDIAFLKNVFDLLFKRNYLIINRIQYTFTEPSFIGMHIFGILLPIYFLSKNRKILWLIIAFIVTTLLFNSSVRFIVDVFVIIIILMILYFIKKKNYSTIILSAIIFIVLSFVAYNSNDRIKAIVDKGVYADNSLATRYFRIQASVYGYAEEPGKLLIGYGMGNSILPLRNGYYLALEKYKNSYMHEIIELGKKDYYDASVSYCLYIRIISEYGILMFIAIIYALVNKIKDSKFKYKYEILFVLLYLYLQFDSYAFYSIWLLIFIISNDKYISSNQSRGELYGKFV